MTYNSWQFLSGVIEGTSHTTAALRIPFFSLRKVQLRLRKQTRGLKTRCLRASGKTKLQNTKFWSKGGLQQNVFFYEPVFCKMWKLIVFFGPFFGKFWLLFKKHYKKVFQHIFKSKKRPFSKLLTAGPSWGTKKGQLGPDNNFENLRAIFFYRKCAETPIFIVFLTNNVFKKANLAQLITLKMAKLGPDNNSTTYIYICCKVKNGPRFAFL